MNNLTEVLILGQKFTVEEFAIQELEGDIQLAIATIEVLISRGEAEVLGARKSKTTQKIEKALKEKESLNKADYVRHEEEKQKDNRAQTKKEGRLLHEQIIVDYNAVKQAKEHKALFEENLRLDGIQLVMNDDDSYSLVIPNVSDKDVDYISRTLKADSIVGGAVKGIDMGITGATKAVDYTAKKVLSPTIAIATKGVVSIGRTLFSTVAKAGGTMISAGAEGGRRTASELSQDDDIIKAKQELINAKNGIRRGFNSTVGGSSSRIRY